MELSAISPGGWLGTDRPYVPAPMAPRLNSRARANARSGGTERDLGPSISVPAFELDDDATHDGWQSPGQIGDDLRNAVLVAWLLVSGEGR